MVEGASSRRPPESNGLGLAGFIVSLVGLCSGGVLSPIGLILSLVALGKRPRGFAIAGVVLGVLGSCGILPAIVIAIVAPALLLALAATAGIAGMLGPQFEAQIEMGQLNAQIEAYREETGALPMTLADLDLGADTGATFDLSADPWDNPYVYTLAPNGMSYTIHSMGPDGVDGTADDVTVDSSLQIGAGVD